MQFQHIRNNPATFNTSSSHPPRFVTAAATAPTSPINYAWDWSSVAVGMVLSQQLGGLKWGHIRLKVVGSLLVGSAVLIALARCVRVGCPDLVEWLLQSRFGSQQCAVGY
jgi:hypothetical protein